MPDWYRTHDLSPEAYPDSEYRSWAQDNGLHVDAAGNVDYGPPQAAEPDIFRPPADPDVYGDGGPDECEVDGYTEDANGGEHYWHCGRPGAITVDGVLMCEDHAGEQGYGPKQEEYGFDPSDRLEVKPDA